MTQAVTNPRLKITLLGTPIVQLNGEIVTGFVSNKATALLYYLAATGQTHSREMLSSLLWGEYPDAKARKNLRDILFNLRRLMGSFLDISRQTVGLVPDGSIEVDVQRFEATAKTLEDVVHPHLSPAAMVVLREGVDLYQGDFLEGFYISQAPDFDAWLTNERSRLQQMEIQALHLLVEYLTHQGNTTLGINYATQLLNMEPWREETHRHLMQLLVWSGQRSAALAQYETCRRTLAENLGVDPEPETRHLYEYIMQGSAILAPSLIVQDTVPSFKPTPHNLPAQLTRFVGREADLAEIVDRLHDPDYRLVVVVGPGGVGKTRLVLQAARLLLSQVETGTAFRDGIYFVRLASIEQHEVNRNLTLPGNYNPVAAAIADALHLTVADPEAPASRIENYLREKEILLVMDNFEHLAGAGGYLTMLLAGAPRLKLLVTSRSRLNVRGEHVYVLDGLPFPTKTADTLSWQGYGAVRLFLQTAQAMSAKFQLLPEEDTAVVRICQLVNGLPLGIELAASWVRVLSCSEIVGELEQNLMFLQTSASDVSEQHRSLWAVFTYSWNMLTAEQQRALRQLSVFRGGFVREAAAVVADAPLTTLAKLIDHSFVRRVDNGQRKPRFELLEVLRLYAVEQLQQHPTEDTAVYNRHCDYFMTYLQQQQPRLQGAEQRQALNDIGLEIENIRAAWRWSVWQQDLPALDKGLKGLFDYYDMRSRFREGRDAFERAAVVVQAVQPQSRESRLIGGRLLARQGWFTFHIGRYPEARQLLQQSMAMIRPLDAPADLVFCLNYQGAVCFHLGEYAQAQALCQEALALSQAIAYQPGAGIALNILSQIAYQAGDFAMAQMYGNESLAIVTHLGNPWSRAFSLSNLAQVAFARQAYEEVRRLSQTILEIREEMGDVRGMAMCLEQLAHTAVAQQKPDDALTLYRRSLALYRDIGNPRGIISTLASIGRLTLQEEAYDLARVNFTDALRRAVELQSVPDLPLMVSGLAVALRESGDGATAVALEKLLATEPLPLPELAALLEMLPN